LGERSTRAESIHSQWLRFGLGAGVFRRNRAVADIRLSSHDMNMTAFTPLEQTALAAILNESVRSAHSSAAVIRSGFPRTQPEACISAPPGYKSTADDFW
jgi:hypothetical protein